MKELKERLTELLEPLRVALGRLTQREQFIVIAGSVGAALLVLLLVGWLTSSAISSAQNRVKIKTEQLTEVLRLEGEYKSRQLQAKQQLRELKRSNVRLVSIVEKVARETGVEIGRMEPDDGEPNADGIVESTLEMRASKLSADRLQDFLSKIEKERGIIIINRLKVNKPYRRDTVDVELTLTTYKAEGT